MRVAFIPPSVQDYKALFSPPAQRLLRGGGLGDIRTLSYEPSYHRGAGLFGTLAGFAKRAFPFLFRNVVAPVAQGVLGDAVSGKRNLKESLKTHGVGAVKEAGRRLLTGGGVRRARGGVRKVKRKILKGKATNRLRYKRDVFSGL